MPINSKILMLNSVAVTLFQHLVKLFATKQAMLYIEGCGHNN